MLDNVFVIMPAYNAGKTIERVFARVPEEARRRIKRYIVVDDGSTDNTAEVVRKLQSSCDNLVLLRHERNRGYGVAEKTLLNHALKEGVEVAILLHSDGQYSPERIPALLEPFDNDTADMVQGSRILGGAFGRMPLYKFIANKCLTAVENLGFGMRLAEYHSGYMLYNRKALETIPFNKLSDSFDFDLEMLVMAKVKGLRITELPIPTIYADEVSHVNSVKYGFQVLGVVRDYRRGKYHAL